MKNLDLNQFLDKDIDLTQFFSQQELDDMGIHQQTRLKNIAQNYEIMLYMGKTVIDLSGLNISFYCRDPP
jgi:2-hydroxy-3-keto-5-methylthiopentenyl-1-phosphate phosphatase